MQQIGSCMYMPSQAERMRQMRDEHFADASHTTAALLEELHSPPEWWQKGKALSLGQYDSFDKLMKTAKSKKGGKKPKRAMQRAIDMLISHFNYHAAHAIQKYFSLRPESPVSFEQLYGIMLEYRWDRFFSHAKKFGIRAATGALAKRVFYVAPHTIASFEETFVKRLRPGRWVIGGRSRLILPLTQTEFETSKSRGRVAELTHSGKKKIREGFSTAPLTKNERFVIRRHFLVKKPQELVEIAKQINRSRERARQLKESALQKMRGHQSFIQLERQRKVHIDSLPRNPHALHRRR